MSLKIDQFIKDSFANFGFELSNTQINQLNVYLQLLIEWNKKMNLTAITDPREIVVKHFLDSAALLKYTNIQEDASVVDVGTGAGFPGVVLKVLRPDLQITLLDSLKKRLTFLTELLSALNLNACVVHSRAEDGARNQDLREKFDLVTSRAVAKLNVLCEYCLAYAKVEALFCPLKGPNIEEEISTAQNSMNVMGGKLEGVKSFALQDSGRRTIAMIRKVKHTPVKYPRSQKKILQHEL